jgi:DNA-binding PadR family transcriptional regulator
VSSEELTTTSYAILGLLAVKPWSTYELARQMERSFRHFWPRAESRIYEEPKRLAHLGLARAKREAVGQRPRTVYSITARGRRALAAWLDEPGGRPQLECEALLKVFLAEFATKEATLSQVAVLRSWARGMQDEHTAVAREVLASGGVFPERVPQLVLVGRFLSDFADFVAAWSDWASRVVAAWGDDVSDRVPELAALEAMAARSLDGAPATDA